MTLPVAAIAVRDLVRRLGGPMRVGRQLGVTCEAVCNWSRKDAVPAARQLALWRMAQAAGIAWQPPGTEGLALGPSPALAAPLPVSNDAHKSAA